MKIINIYEACDGRQFTDYHECEFYEQEVLKLRLRMCPIEFWDKDRKNMLHPLFTDVNYEIKMDELMSECEYLNLREDIPQIIQDYIRDIWGWNIPIKKGIYQYDWNKLKWIRET